MDYIGSKLKLLQWIFSIIEKEKKNESVFLDGCCGSGVVSKFAAQKGYSVIANDLMLFSSSIVNGSIGLESFQIQEASEHIGKINSLDGLNGFFYNNFSEKSNPPRLYFTYENAQKIDAARNYIEKIKDKKIKDYLIYCGLEAISRVSNTTGVQSAFLKKFKKRALGNFELKKEKIYSGDVDVYNLDIMKCLDLNLSDYILYIDPPYNRRQYGANYHIYETFTRNDNPKIKGVAGLRNWENESKSNFCSVKNCLNFTYEIIDRAKCKKIFISYSSDGIMRIEDFEKKFGDSLKYYSIENTRYKADSSSERQYNANKLYEYLIVIEK